MTRVPIPRFTDPPTDGSIALRHWTEGDVPAMTAACRDPEVQRWTAVPADYEEQFARNFIAGTAVNLTQGRALETAVIDVREGTLVGSVGLVTIDFANSRGEVGYWVAPEARGRGVAAAAVRLISGVAFGDLGLVRLDLLVATPNEASQRVAEKAGFTREGVLRSCLANKEGGRDDAVIFGLVRGDAR